MDTLLLLKALILGVVEGLTEFLPISSTGHLILAGDLLDFNDDAGKIFEIVIQFGAILAVVWEYRARLWETIASCPTSRKAQRFLINVAVAFMPLAILGLLFHKTIKAHLFNPISVATAFIVGALFIFWAEKRAHRVRVPSVDDMTIKDALMLGCIQAFALIPGTSRSGRHHYRWLAHGLVSQSGHRILILSGDSDAGRRNDLPGLQRMVDNSKHGSEHVGCRLRIRIYFSIPLYPLVVAVHHHA